jgi:GT2 family glycosyltransferase
MFTGNVYSLDVVPHEHYVSNGVVVHNSGIFFSLLHRCFEHIYKYAPADLPEALCARRCPVTAALQFIRHDCLEHVGLYDGSFLLGWEDVDYCIRTFQAGGECVYQGAVRAYHHEFFTRGRPSPKIADWQNRSWLYLVEKYKHTSFAEFCPSLT